MNMKTTILFVRHGESESNLMKLLTVDPDKYHLTERGKEQAERLAKELSSLPINGLYTSPILRAVETAGIISKRLGLEASVERLLSERDHGKANEIAVPTLELEIELYSEPKKYGIEQIPAIANRVMKFMDTVDERVVVAVTHADVIRAFVARLLLLDGDEFSSYALVPEKATITAVQRNRADWRILALGSPKVTDAITRAAEA